MKKIGVIALAFALVLGMSQCKKENTTASNDEGTKVPITLNVSGNSGSKVAVDGTTGVVTFEDGDVLYVSSSGVYVGTMTYNGTVFSGEINEPTEGQKLQFYFLGNKTPEFNSDNTGCSVVISDQTEYLPVISYAPSRENYQVGLTVYNATLLNKCALVKFNVTTSSDAATCILGMNNKVTVDFSTNEFTYSQEDNGAITMPAGNGEKWVILLPQDEVTQAETHSADGNYSGTCASIPTIAENDYLTTGIVVSVSISFHGYVDLGLPSGLLWATCNVGASSPEEYGDYFAWGETTPKDTYDWTNYQYSMGSSNTLTKYCSNSNFGYNGFTDNLTTLLPEDDAATVNWGEDWRMPTRAEFEELYAKTSVTSKQLGGVSGELFTAANGASLFLPDAGYRTGSEFKYVGSGGLYRSSSLCAEIPDNAWNCCTDRVYGWSTPWHLVLPDARFMGLSVRAVREN